MATLLKELYVGNVYGNWYLRLYEDSISQSIDGNYTNVLLRLTLYATSSTYVSFDNRDAWIHGTHFSIAYSHNSGEHDLGSTTLRIDHNADGSGSYSVGFGMSTSYVLNGSGAGGRTLPTIPRASSFTISSNNILGSAMSVTITRASSSFTHKVRYQFGTIVRDYANQGTSCTFTPPYEDGSQIPNAMSGQGTITVYTYNGSSLIGNKSANFSMSVNATVFAPTFTGIAVTRVDNGVPASWGVYVQGKSKASIQIQGTSAKYGASITAYQINVEGFSGGNGLVAGPFQSGTLNIKATVIDSRNITTNKVTQIVVYENSPPTLSMKAQRCNSAGTPNNNGTYIKITPTYSCASVNGKNYIASKVFKINGTSYQNTTSASDTSFILGNNDIAVSKAYVVSGSVSDALGQSSATISINIPTSSVPFHVREDQDGVAFGKYSEREGIDSAWDIYIQGRKVLTQNDCPHPIGTILHNNLSSFNPNVTYPNTTWSRYAQGRVLVGINEHDGDFNTTGKTGGTKNEVLSVSQIPSHSHTSYTKSRNILYDTGDYDAAFGWHANTSMGYRASPMDIQTLVGINTTGGGQAHNNLQPYIAVYMWVRIT